MKIFAKYLDEIILILESVLVYFGCAFTYMSFNVIIWPIWLRVTLFLLLSFILFHYVKVKVAKLIKKREDKK